MDKQSSNVAAPRSADAARAELEAAEASEYEAHLALDGSDQTNRIWRERVKLTREAAARFADAMAKLS